jgi:hypothetical protein
MQWLLLPAARLNRCSRNDDRSDPRPPSRHGGCRQGIDGKDFVKNCRQLTTTAHVAQKQKGSAIDGRTTRHQGYNESLRIRKRVEEVFGWLKTVGCMRKLRHRGCDRVDAVFTMATACMLA